MAAAAEGHLDCLRAAHQDGCSWNERTCHSAAGSGHLDCLRYAHENDCRWDEWTCKYAAEYGHLDCLRYAHENGCPWDEDTCESAARYGYLDCERYALVANLVEDIMGRVLEAERVGRPTGPRRSSSNKVGRWLEWLYRPGSRSCTLRVVASDFVSRQPM
jgi:hypothetical protein